MARARRKALARWKGMAAVVGAAAIGAALYTGSWSGVEGPAGERLDRGELPEVGGGAPSPADDDPGLVIHGFVQARTLDPARWSVRGTPLVYEECRAVPTSGIDSRGRFELTGLLDVDYRVELVCEGERPIVLASAEHVRPGCDELVLELDPLAVLRLKELRDPDVRPRE